MINNFDITLLSRIYAIQNCALRIELNFCTVAGLLLQPVHCFVACLLLLHRCFICLDLQDIIKVAIE